MSLGFIKQTNTEIVQVLQPDSEVLAQIQDSFHTMVMARNEGRFQKLNITCFYEELPVPGVGFVRQSETGPATRLLTAHINFMSGSSKALSDPARVHPHWYS
jgi:hypothetical protein